MMAHIELDGITLSAVNDVLRVVIRIELWSSRAKVAAGRLDSLRYHGQTLASVLGIEFIDKTLGDIR